MKIATAFLAALVLAGSLVVGCAPVAAQNDQTQSQRRDWVSLV